MPNALDGGGKVRCRSGEGGREELPETVRVQRGEKQKQGKVELGKNFRPPNTWFVFRCQYLILISSHMSRKDMVVRRHTGKETVREREGENKTPSGF